MTDQKKPFRPVRPRLWTALGSTALGTIAAAGLAAGGTALALSTAATTAHAAGQVQLADAGEGGEGSAAKAGGEGGEGSVMRALKAGGEGGEGEGGSRAPDEADFLTGLSFMEGHLRAGLHLYETGDLAAAKTHMGHPIEEKYDAVEDKLERRGFGDLESQISTLANDAEAEKPLSDIQAQFDQVASRLAEAEAASPGGAPAQLRSLALLTRIAANEYSASLKDGRVAKQHEYQDAWGFLRAVEVRANRYAQSDDEAVASAAAEILEQLHTTDAAFGDIQGKGDFQADPALLYAAAARMEIAALGVK